MFVYWSLLRGDLIALFQNYINLAEDLAGIFILNAASTTIGNLKSIFLNKGLIKPLYATTFVDALVCALALKMLASSSGLACIIVFAAGRIIGAWLGNRLEEQLALGVKEVSIYKHPEEGIKLAALLHAEGYSATCFMGLGAEGKERLIITIVVPRRHLNELKAFLKSQGRLNMAVKDVSKTYGKVGSINPRPAG